MCCVSSTLADAVASWNSLLQEISEYFYNNEKYQTKAENIYIMPTP